MVGFGISLQRLATFAIRLTIAFVFAAPAYAQQTTNDNAGKIVVPLSGTAADVATENLTLAPLQFDAGIVDIGATMTGSATLTHTGDVNSAPIEINGTSLFGQNPGDFYVSLEPTTLNPGSAIRLDFTFTPIAPGERSAGLRINIGNAKPPVVMLLKGSSRYPLTSDIAVSVNNINFGKVLQDEPAAKSFTVTNLGASDAPAINVSAMPISGIAAGDFSSNFSPFSLAPGESKKINIQMQTATATIKTAKIVIEHDGNNSAPEIALRGEVTTPVAVTPEFTQSTLTGAEIIRGTSFQFGPDGKLYVAQVDGSILIFNVTRNGKNNYNANKLQTITSIKSVTNHNDDGKVNKLVNRRLVTGMFVTGTAGAPIIYSASADPRQAAGPSGTDANLDTNSGILHKLTKDGNDWNKQDLVRGLPRSEENHVPNGLLLHNGKILIMSGGNTNQGAPSNNFAELPETALSAAVLEIDINSIGNSTYDLPTLDDEDRPGVNDANDPFGGNNGKNQAKLVQDGPVQIFASGMRNAYDLVKTKKGKLYTFDNGPNTGWGGTPVGDCTNDIAEGGSFHQDNLHVFYKGFYGGHPNPTRGNKSNTFNSTNPQSPIEGPANPEECVYKAPGPGDGALTTIGSSSNGITEYTASNFGNAMKGDLLVVSFNKSVSRLQLNNSGNGLISSTKLFTGVGQAPLDIIAQDDGGPFPGTIWVLDNLKREIMIFEPVDY